MTKGKSQVQALGDQESSWEQQKINKKIRKNCQRAKRNIPNAEAQAKTYLDQFLQSKTIYFDKPLEDSTLILKKKYKDDQITQKLGQLRSRQDLLFNVHLPRKEKQEDFLYNKLIQIMTIKNLEKSFSQTPLDFFNYHKANETFQKNRFFETSFSQITTITKFKTYISKRKPTILKHDRHLLFTACSACFTQYSSPSNPIQNCPQCHIRIHRYCQNKQNRCHRCRYGRMNNLEKEQTSYCFLCNRPSEKGLMVITVTRRKPRQFAHQYCLLLHHFWRMENKVFIGEYHRPFLQNQICTFCFSGSGHYLDCTSCGKTTHGMCAYLNGCSLRLERSQNNYKVLVDCCNQPVQKERLSIERRFKINYEKIIFRQNKELYWYIQQKWKRCKEEEISL